MPDLVALALQPSTFDPVRSTLAGASLLGNQIQNAAALQDLRMAPERNQLALEQARARNELARLELQYAPQRFASESDLARMRVDLGRSELERAPLALEEARRRSALAQLQLGTAQQRQTALDAFRTGGGMGSASALQHLSGDPELFGSALGGYGQYETWRNTQRARGGQRVLAAGPDGSDARNQAWQQELDSAVQGGLITPDQRAQLGSQSPTDLRLQGIIDLARPLTNEPSLNDIMRMQIGGDASAGPPASTVNPGSSAVNFGLRNDFGLNNIPVDVMQNAEAIQAARDRLQASQPAPAPDDGTRVRGWIGTAEAQTPPAPAPNMPGMSIAQPGDTSFETPSWALGAGAGTPPAAAGPENVGQVTSRVLSSATPAQRARFWTLMSRQATRDDAMKLLQEIESGGAPLTARQRAETEEGLRNEFRALAKPYLDMGDSLSRIEASRPTAEGDLSLVYNFMRMLDPGSVVRETEFAMLGRSGGLPEQVQQLFSRVVGNGQLTPAMREAVRGQSRELLRAQEERHLAIQRQYGSLAQRLGLSPENVMIDFSRPTGSADAQLIQEARQAIASGRDAAAVRERLRQKGVDPALLDR